MKLITIIPILVLAFGLAGTNSQAGEHGGKEHGGKEHKDKKEHKHKEHGGKAKHHKDDIKCAKDDKKCIEEADKKKKAKKHHDHGRVNVKKSKPVAVKDIKKALTEYIASHTDSSGVYNYKDADRSGKNMKLRFVKIHDPVRHMEQKGQYFACTDFQVESENGKLHDLDFWMVPTENGLKVVKTKVHKDPQFKGKKWEKVPRYTFKGEDIVKLTK